jgi:hypothetical protein
VTCFTTPILTSMALTSLWPPLVNPRSIASTSLWPLPSQSDLTVSTPVWPPLPNPGLYSLDHSLSLAPTDYNWQETR